MTFTELIDHLQARPEMYLGEMTFEKLKSYLLGYQICCRVNGINDPFDGLSELIQCRVGRRQPLGWSGGIRHFFARDEQHAIKLVFSAIHDLHKIKKEKGLDWLKTEFDRMEGLKRARAMNPDWPSKRPQTNKAEQNAGGNGS